jgi:hypothetical protein
MKQKIYQFLPLLLIIFFSTHVAGEIVNESNYTAEYDSIILDAFNNHTWVPVLIRLVDNSNINVTGSKDERRVFSRQRDEWLKPVIEEVLATLSETEFNLSSRLFDGFSGVITKEGFDKLLNNTAVRKIIWENTPLPEAATNENISAEYDSEILEAFNNQTWMRFIIYYRSDIENMAFDTIEERKNYVNNLTHSLFDYIPSTMIRNIKSGLSNSFTAEITEEGFNELIKNEKVSEIYLDVIGSVAIDESGYTAEYDPRILDFFNNHTIAEPIVEEFNNQTWVRVIVDLKDNSGINVTGTKEERTNLSRQIDEWFKPIVDDMYNMFSEDEFIIRKSLRGLSGQISEKGFNKLIKDVRVKYVHMDAVGSVVIDENNIDVRYNMTNENIHDSEKNGTKNNDILIEPESKENLSSKKQITEEEHKSLFLRVIQFFKNLFGIK